MRSRVAVIAVFVVVALTLGLVGDLDGEGEVELVESRLIRLEDGAESLFQRLQKLVVALPFVGRDHPRDAQQVPQRRQRRGSKSDERYPKYPRLPVKECPGYVSESR